MLFIIVVIVVVALVLLALFGIRVDEHSAVVVERLGRFSRVLGPGFHVIVPVVDRPRDVSWSFQGEKNPGERKGQRSWHKAWRMDLRVNTLDIPPKSILTKDKTEVKINATIRFRIVDPRLAVYSICNLYQAICEEVESAFVEFFPPYDLHAIIERQSDLVLEVTKRVNQNLQGNGVEVQRIVVQEIPYPQHLVKEIETRRQQEQKAETQRQAVAQARELEEKKKSLIIAEHANNILRVQNEWEMKKHLAEAELGIKRLQQDLQVELLKSLNGGALGPDVLRSYIAMQNAQVLASSTNKVFLPAPELGFHLHTGKEDWTPA